MKVIRIEAAELEAAGKQQLAMSEFVKTHGIEAALISLAVCVHGEKERCRFARERRAERFWKSTKKKLLEMSSRIADFGSDE